MSLARLGSTHASFLPSAMGLDIKFKFQFKNPFWFHHKQNKRLSIKTMFLNDITATKWTFVMSKRRIFKDLTHYRISKKSGKEGIILKLINKMF